jgi:periplasmic protein TonB
MSQYRLYFVIILLVGIILPAYPGNIAGDASSQTPDTVISQPDSIRYPIRIVPHDTATDEHMPVYTPDAFTEVDKHPVPIRTIYPSLPDSARILGIDGMVWVKCLIDTNGNVKKAAIIRSTHEIFDSPAIAAILQWKFTPAILQGRKVQVWATVPLRFRGK